MDAVKISVTILRPRVSSELSAFNYSKTLVNATRIFFFFLIEIQLIYNVC